MKKLASVFATVVLAIIGVTSPAIAGGAPQCFLDRPQTCSSYDYIEDSINGNGELCKTRYFNSGSTQSAVGIGCTPIPKPEPKPEPVKEPEKPKFQETCSTTDTSDPKKAWSCINSQGFLVEYSPKVVAETAPKTEVVNTVPSSTVSAPTVIGSRNNVSTVNSNTVNNINSTYNSTSNVTTNISNVDASNKVSNAITSNDFRVITVNGGYLVFGADGAAKFFPSSQPQQTTKPVSEETEVVYLDREDLPRSLSKAIDRLPEEVKSKKSVKLSAVLRNAESVTEDTCLVEKGRLVAVSKGACVLEIAVGSDIYEHEIEIVK